MAYTDMTNTFIFNRQLLWTDWDALADNAKGAYDDMTEYGFFAYRSTNQSIVNTAMISFDQTSWNVGSFFSTITSAFTPSVLGRYFITAAVSFDASTLNRGNRYAIYLTKNNSSYNFGVWGRYMAATRFGFPSDPPLQPLTISLFAVIDQTVATDFWRIHVTSEPLDASYTVVGSLASCYFCGYRVANY